MTKEDITTIDYTKPAIFTGARIQDTDHALLTGRNAIKLTQTRKFFCANESGETFRFYLFNNVKIPCVTLRLSAATPSGTKCTPSFL